MKRLFSAIVLFGLITLTSASTRGDVKILEATENIQYLSQKIAKDYFFFYKNSEDSLLKEQLYKNIENLQFYINDIIDIADTKQGVQTKNLLNYFIYRIEQIKEVPDQKIDFDNARLILEYSEVLLEGAKSIAKEHKYQFSKDEKMLMTSKEIQYLLERVTKYYIASQIGLKSDTNLEELREAIINIDTQLKSLENYTYPYEFKEKLNKINTTWKINRDFFYQPNTPIIPYLLLNSTQYIEKLLKDVEQYHKKNL